MLANAWDMETKLKDKLLKLYELSKRGVDGEKVNADLMLTRFLHKHGLTINDINQELPKNRYYKYTNTLNKQIISQIIYKVLNGGGVYSVKGSKKITAKITDYQHVQILELVDYHLENFNKERNQFLKDFKSAYVQKHKLYRDTTSKDIEDVEPLTVEEKQAIWRMSNIKQCLSNSTYQKKIR